jgi:prepilin-type N-terminal cleavage/methylation domain-containing protein
MRIARRPRSCCRHSAGRTRSSYTTRCYRFCYSSIRLSRSSILAPQSSPLRGAMTLIELLVVIVIMTVIVAAAIPLMSPSNDDRRLREAARGLNTFITGAQSRAIAHNRPCGIALKRLSRDTKRAEDNGVSLEVYYVEQQPPYAGFDANSRACVALHPTKPGYVITRLVTRGTLATDSLPNGWDKDLFPPGTIRPGDIIEINGTRFELLYSANDQYTRVTRDKATNTYFEDPFVGGPRPVQILARPINDSGQQINPRHDDKGNELTTNSKAPYWTQPAPYKIFRQPTPMADEPYQLPEGTAIDLRASGVGSGDYFYVQGVHDDPTFDNVLVMFAPEGRVSRVTFSRLPNDENPFDQTVADNVFLLVGRRENSAPMAASLDPTLQSMGPMSDEERAKLRTPLNWLLGSSRWVVIGSQSGRVATVENAAADLSEVYSTYTSTPYKLSAGSEELRNAQILAAREFTREMGQVGGR